MFLFGFHESQLNLICARLSIRMMNVHNNRTINKGMQINSYVSICHYMNSYFEKKPSITHIKQNTDFTYLPNCELNSIILNPWNSEFMLQNKLRNMISWSFERCIANRHQALVMILWLLASNLFWVSTLSHEKSTDKTQITWHYVTRHYL